MGRQPQMKSYIDLPWVNLTPHPVIILDDDGKELRSWESNGSLRLEYAYATGRGGIRYARIEDVTGPLDWEKNKFIIVSRAMAMGLLEKNLPIVFAYPDLEVRADDSRIIGCRTLTRLVA
jgi:hypothetical protein